MEEVVSQRSVGRYSIYRELASGGMATVYLGRLHAAGGISRIVAIKRLHPQFSRDPDFVSMFLDEARLAARIHHPNVVPTLDVLVDEGELFVVMEYVRGESLSKICRGAKDQGEHIPVPIVTSIVSGMLMGLHTAHEATDEQGQPLGIVHRDVSPQNVMVGSDGTARVLDFGVAKAASRLHQTRDGQLKGKLAYMAPEQVSEDGEVTRQSDIYAAGIVLWEALAGRYLFRAGTDGKTLSRLLSRDIDPPSKYNEAVSPELDAVTLRALEPVSVVAVGTAREMAEQLDAVERGASLITVGAWVQQIAAATLKNRQETVRDIESGCAESLSGFAVMPAGFLGGDGLGVDELASASQSRSKSQHGTAVTVRSSKDSLIDPDGTEPQRPKRRMWLVGLGLAAGIGGGVLVMDRMGGWLGMAPPPDPTSAATEQISAEPAATDTAPAATAEPTATSEPTATTSETASDVAPSSSVTTNVSAKPPVARPKPIARPAVSPAPPSKDTSGKDPDDIDSLIETRK